MDNETLTVPSTEINRMWSGEKLGVQGDYVLGPGVKENVINGHKRNQGKEVICGRKLHLVLFMLLLRYQHDMHIETCRKDDNGTGAWERPGLAERI